MIPRISGRADRSTTEAMMSRGQFLTRALLPALVVLLATSASAQQPRPAPPALAPGQAPPAAVSAPAVPDLEPKAIEILKASSNRLAAARTMRFTAVVSYESPSRPGPPLVYTTKSEVTVQRPNKLRVITPGDGPASEFYYDGKTMMAFAPAENLVAVADAPPTIDAALKAAFESAAIYFPFTDVIVADPYQDIADDLVLAFYIGQSREVGGTTTDMVAYAHNDVFVQVWIGAKDKLPRRARAVYRSDPAQLRHQMDLSDWQLNSAVPAKAFASARAAAAKRIPFARPEPIVFPGTPPPVEQPPAKTP
jgi:hypothetical protein